MPEVNPTESVSDAERIPTREEIEAAVGGDEAPPEVPELLACTTPEEKVIGARLLPAIVAKARAAAQAETTKELAKYIDQLKVQNTRMIEDEIKKLRDSVKPPDPEQLEKLLSQEYGEITVEIPQRRGENKGTSRRFLIRELPQEAEKRFFQIISKRILPYLKEIAATEWAASATQGEKLQKVLEVIPEALDMLAECAVIALDPYNEEGITLEWVQRNLGSNRIMGIVEAQIMVAKIRDFFSAAYRLMPQ